MGRRKIIRPVRHPPEEGYEEQRVRGLVVRYSRGNPLLCRGLYTTRQDVKRRLEELTSFPG